MLSGNDECGMMDDEFAPVGIPRSSSVIAVPPPWTLSGSAIGTTEKVRLKSGVLFPIALRAFVHYQSSPVGAYDEVALIALTNRGFSVIEMLVNSRDSQIGGRRGWGFPKELANLQWRRRGARVEFEMERKILRFRVTRFSIPLALRGFVVQELNGENVRVPTQISGCARIAFSGKRIALLLEDFAMHVAPPEKL